jgi:hypothetical protein
LPSAFSSRTSSSVHRLPCPSSSSGYSRPGASTGKQDSCHAAPRSPRQLATALLEVGSSPDAGFGTLQSAFSALPRRRSCCVSHSSHYFRPPAFCRRYQTSMPLVTYACRKLTQQQTFAPILSCFDTALQKTEEKQAAAVSKPPVPSGPSPLQVAENKGWAVAGSNRGPPACKASFPPSISSICS